MSIYCILICIFCIFIQNMLNRIGPCWTLCAFIGPTTTRAYTAQLSHASLIVALCAEEIAADQLPGHGLYPPAWDIWWRFSAQDRNHMVLQTSAPVQNPYKDRHWHAVPRVCLCFSAGRVQGPTKTRSCFAYFAYFVYFDLFIGLSLAGSVSICNPLRTPWTSTSFVCYSSVFHTGTPSSCSCGSDRDNTLRHASRSGWLSRSFLR